MTPNSFTLCYHVLDDLFSKFLYFAIGSVEGLTQTMEKAIDMVSIAGFDRTLHQLQVDDFAFLGVFVFLSLYYALRGVVWEKSDPYYHLWFEKPQGDGAVKEANTRDIGKKLEQMVSVKPFMSLRSPKVPTRMLIYVYQTEQESGHILGFSIWHC